MAYALVNGKTGASCGTPPVVEGGGSTGGGSTGGGSTGGGSTGGGSTGGGSTRRLGSAVTVSLGGPVIPAAPVLQAGTTKTAIIASNSAKLFSVKVLQSKLGRYLVVNVKGTAKTANVRIQIMGKNGKVLKTIVRTVPTNRAFRSPTSSSPKTATSVRASVTRRNRTPASTATTRGPHRGPRSRSPFPSSGQAPRRRRRCPG